MARYLFGGDIPGYTITLSGSNVQMASAQVVRFYSAESGGTQYTDLQNMANAPITQVTSSDGTDGKAPGQIPQFQGPDGVRVMWAQAGSGGPRAIISTYSDQEIVEGGGGGEGGADRTRWIYPEDFGAVANGATDCTAAFAAAMAAAATIKGTIYCGPSQANATYKFTDEVLFRDDVRLVGGGTSKSVVFKQVTSNKSIFYGNNVQGGEISHVWFEGPGKTAGSAPLINLGTDLSGIGGNPYWSFEDVRFNEAPVGIYMENTFVTVFKGKTIALNCGVGFKIQGQVPSGSAGTSVTMNAPFAISCTTGFDIRTMTYCTMVNPAADHCTTGYLLDNVHTVTMTAVGSEYTAADSGLTNPTTMKINNCKSVNIVGLYAYNNYYGIIDITGVSHVNVTNVEELNDLAVTPSFSIKGTGSSVIVGKGGIWNLGTALSLSGGASIRVDASDAQIYMAKAGTSTATLDNFGGSIVSNTNIVVPTGAQYRIGEGSNACMGTSTLTAGTVTVSTNKVNTSSRIFLQTLTPGGTPGWLRVSAISAGTSFTITSSSGSDTSVVSWVMFQAA